MDWQKERDNITCMVQNFSHLGHTKKCTLATRNEVLKKYNYTCRYCGGIYKKYLMSIKINEVDDVCCRLCYLVTHLNSGLHKEILVFYSELSQLEIIKRTADYIINNGEVPFAQLIDKNIKHVPITILEFINILNNNDKYPIELQSYKIFFSNKLNIDFVLSNYAKYQSLFIDEDIGDVTNNEKPKYHIKKHIPSKQEMGLFISLFA